MSDPRRTIDEVAAICKLEPTLKTIYVEGVNDVNFFTSALGEYLSIGVSLHSIDSVQIDANLLSKYEMSSGNRQRIIVMSRELCSVGGCEGKILCIIDKDLDQIFGFMEHNVLLKYTDYTNIGSYLYKPPFFNRVVCNILRIKSIEADDIYAHISQIVRTSFCMRLAKRHFDLKGPWIPIVNSVNYTNFQYRVVETEAIDKFLQSQSVTRDDKANITEFILKALADYAYYDINDIIHDHDFDQVLTKYINKRSNQFSNVKESAILSLFLIVLPNESILENGLFKDILTWLDLEK